MDTLGCRMLPCLTGGNPTMRDQVADESAGCLELLSRSRQRRIGEMLTKQVTLSPLLLVVSQPEPLEPSCHRRIGLIEGGVRRGRSGLWRGTHDCLRVRILGAPSIDRELDQLDDKAHILDQHRSPRI